MTELSWGTLPGEVLVQIFSYLHYRDTVMAGRVCRHWSAVSRDPLLLAAIVQRDFSPEFVARVVNCVVVGLVKSGHLPSEVRSSILILLHTWVICLYRYFEIFLLVLISFPTAKSFLQRIFTLKKNFGPSGHKITYKSYISS